MHDTISPSKSRGRGWIPWLLLGLIALIGLPFAVYERPLGPDFGHYWGMVRSLWNEHDLFLVNNFKDIGEPVLITGAGYGLELRNLGTPLAWLPWYGLGQLATRLAPMLAPPGMNPEFIWINWANWLYALAGLGLMAAAVRHWFRRRWTLLALGLTLFGTPWVYYATWLRPSPHLVSMLLVALLVLLWQRRTAVSPWLYWTAMGALTGWLVLMANYNFAFVIFPLLDWLALWRTAAGRRWALPYGLVFGGAALLAFAPQLAAWRLFYGSPFAVPYEHQMDWIRPSIPEALFSPFNGLFFNAPAVGLALAGLILFWRRDRGFALRALIACALLVYAIGANLAWWAGGAFGSRYFLSAIPLIVIGMAAWLDGKRAWARLGAALLLAAWTVLLFIQNVSGIMEHGGYVPFAVQLQGQWTVLTRLPQLLFTVQASPVTGTVLGITLAVLTALIVLAAALIWPWAARWAQRLALPLLVVVLCLGAVSTLWIWRSSESSRIAYAANPGYQPDWPRTEHDIVDLSGSYLERASYHFKRGELAASEEDARRAVDLANWATWDAVSPIYDGLFPNAGRRQAAPGLVVRGSSVSVPASALGASGTVDAIIYWEADAPVSGPLEVSLVLTAPNGEVVGLLNAPFTRGLWPVQQWPAGTVVRELYSIPVAITLPKPADYKVTGFVHPAGDLSSLPALGTPWGGAGDKPAAVDLGTVNLAPLAGSHAQTAVFSDTLTLAAYDLAPEQVEPEETVQVALYTQAQSPAAGKYKTFVHLLNSKQEMVAQHDKFVLDTPDGLSNWQPGVQVRDVFQLTLPDNVQPGEYKMVIGWYDPASGARLPVVNEQGQVVGDQVELGTRVRVGK